MLSKWAIQKPGGVERLRARTPSPRPPTLTPSPAPIPRPPRGVQGGSWGGVRLQSARAVDQPRRSSKQARRRHTRGADTTKPVPAPATFSTVEARKPTPPSAPRRAVAACPVVQWDNARIVASLVSWLLARASEVARWQLGSALLPWEPGPLPHRGARAYMPPKFLGGENLTHAQAEEYWRRLAALRLRYRKFTQDFLRLSET